MIMVAPDYMRRAIPNETDYLSWLRSVIYQVAENPKLVIVLRQMRESIVIPVNVRNDDDFHNPPRGAAIVRNIPADLI
jgi:hypothetical protein